MAAVEDLVAQVADPDLRMRLQAAVRSLKEHKRFGLVFEEHVPELAAIPGFPVSVDDTVADRTDPEGRLYRVTKLLKRAADVEPLGGGDLERRQLRDLRVVRRFGEPTYPALLPIGLVGTRSPEARTHSVICGENYHVLETLLYLHEGKVDCIYIDPPYNTGAKDWKYNNRYVDSTDAWRHSKWLAFMRRRLRLAKRLLRPDGVLICTVDEHEVHHLAMLLEELFPRALRYTVTIVHNPKGTFKTNFARVDEYALFCCPDIGADVINPLPAGLFTQAEEGLEPNAADEAFEYLYLRRRGQESGHRRQRPNQFYAILVDEDLRKVVGVGPLLGPDDPYAVTRTGSVTTVYPLDTRNDERVWRYNRDTMQDLIAADEIVVTGHSSRTAQGWVLNHRRPRSGTKRLKTVWWEKRHDAGGHGSDLLTAYLGEAGLFPFPKSVYAVRDCLDAVVHDRPDALIVDFFAGSGTTLHATCLLNAQDGGRRRCVLVTNNEVDEATARRLNAQGCYEGDEGFERYGIFERVTRPRVEGVITGRRPDGRPVVGEHVWAGRRPYAQGFPESAEFYRLRYVDADEVDLGWQFEAVLPALWLRAGAVGDRPDFKPIGAAAVPEGSNFAVLFDESAIRELAAQLATNLDVTHAYLITDSLESFAEMRALLRPGLDVSMLYRDYLRSFVINVEDEAREA